MSIWRRAARPPGGVVEPLADRERALEVVARRRDGGDERRGGLVPELGLGEAELLIGVTDGVVCLDEDPVRELVEGLGPSATRSALGSPGVAAVAGPATLGAGSGGSTRAHRR